MRLSESILLGSTVLTSEPLTAGTVGSSSGCALGMAHLASGCTTNHPLFQQRNVEELAIKYPILDAEFPSPCKCSANTRYGSLLKNHIAHLFDEHVMNVGDWTLEQLADYVRSIEPADSPESVTNPQETNSETLLAH